MTSTEWEEAQEKQRDALIAAAIGLTVEEFDEWALEVLPEEGADGAVVGYTINLTPHAPPGIIRKAGGVSRHIGPVAFDYGAQPAG